MSTTEHEVEVLEQISPRKLLCEHQQGLLIIRCPACQESSQGDDYVHPLAVSVNPCGPNKGEIRIDHNGLVVDRSVYPYGRGVAISIEFACENCWKKFSWNIRFHKGQTFMDADVSKEKLEGPDPFKVIWRD